MLIKNISGAVKSIDIAPSKTVSVPVNGIFSAEELQGQELLNMYEDDYRLVYDLEAELEANGSLPIVVSTDITSAELLALNTTPKALITAPGAGYAIRVKDAVVSLDYGSAAYATNTDLEIKYDDSVAGDGAGAEVTMASFDAILLATADTIATCAGLGQADETNLTINKGVSAIVATGNPVTGDSPITVKLTYVIEAL